VHAFCLRSRNSEGWLPCFFAAAPLPRFGYQVGITQLSHRLTNAASGPLYHLKLSVLRNDPRWDRDWVPLGCIAPGQSRSLSRSSIFLTSEQQPSGLSASSLPLPSTLFLNYTCFVSPHLLSPSSFFLPCFSSIE
jgi:hypothetical protein